jgi:hypothetical protein
MASERFSRSRQVIQSLPASDMKMPFCACDSSSWRAL